MINLLFITNVFDNHLRCLITALKSLDFHCILHPLNNQKFPEEITDRFDSVEPDPKEIIVMTEAMPIMMPSMVRRVRPRLRLNASTARTRSSRKSILFASLFIRDNKAVFEGDDAFGEICNLSFVRDHDDCDPFLVEFE